MRNLTKPPFFAESLQPVVNRSVDTEDLVQASDLEDFHDAGRDIAQLDRRLARFALLIQQHDLADHR
jgi:hypothetical protein